MTSPEALDILNDITTLSQAYKDGQHTARQGLLTAASRLIATLQHPTENALHTLWAQTTYLSILRVALEINLFDAMLQTPPTGEPSAAIASRCLPPGTVDPVLVARMLRHLAAMSTVRETRPDTFAPTPTSRAYATPKYKDTILFIVDDFQPALNAAPGYFRDNGFQAPGSSLDAPFQRAFRQGVHYFEYFDRYDREMGRRFASMMDVWSLGRERWFDEGYYPVRERLIAGAEAVGEEGREKVFLVDVGGGTGHDVTGLRNALGDDIPGKLILQDRPEIITHASVGAKDVKMQHDFLTQQPIKGARAYFLHSIIQDWPDSTNTQILSSLVPALTRNYSKILINDFVVPDQGAHWSQTALDWALMTSLGARHRTQAEHARLYESVGLKVVGVWRAEAGRDAVIELELA